MLGGTQQNAAILNSSEVLASIISNFRNFTGASVTNFSTNTSNPNSTVYTLVLTMPDGSLYTIFVTQNRTTGSLTTMITRQNRGEVVIINLLNNTELQGISQAVRNSESLLTNGILVNATINNDNSNQTVYRLAYLVPNGSAFIVTVTVNTITRTVTINQIVSRGNNSTSSTVNDGPQNLSTLLQNPQLTKIIEQVASNSSNLTNNRITSFTVNTNNPNSIVYTISY